jgi:hypothetical protein
MTTTPSEFRPPYPFKVRCDGPRDGGYACGNIIPCVKHGRCGICREPVMFIYHDRSDDHYAHDYVDSLNGARLAVSNGREIVNGEESPNA